MDPATTGRAPAVRVLDELALHGPVKRPADAGGVRGDLVLVYAVLNGDNVLQVGKGDGTRFRKCMRRGRAGKHNKAYVCAVGELVLGRANSYAYVEVAKSDQLDIEDAAKQAAGIGGGVSTTIAGIACTSLREIHTQLWALAKGTTRYAALDTVEKLMAEELFELVTWATAVVERTGGSVRSRFGDVLEGNILVALDKAYLIPVFEKLVDGYLTYGKTHRPGAMELERRKRNYEYVPKGVEFEVHGATSATPKSAD